MKMKTLSAALAAAACALLAGCASFRTAMEDSFIDGEGNILHVVYGERSRPYTYTIVSPMNGAELECKETKMVRIPAAEAYGEWDERRVQSIAADNQVMVIIDAKDLPVGKTIHVQGPGGRPQPVKVLSVDDKVAKLDMNHELAGKDLTFEITLVEAE